MSHGVFDVKGQSERLTQQYAIAAAQGNAAAMQRIQREQDTIAKYGAKLTAYQEMSYNFSKYHALCKEKMLPKVQAFVTDLGLQNGVIGIEAVVKDNDIFVFEMQFRLGGMRHHNFVLKENGMDLLAMLVRFAVTGKFEGWDASVCDNAAFKNCYCSLSNQTLSPKLKVLKR